MYKEEILNKENEISDFTRFHNIHKNNNKDKENSNSGYYVDLSPGESLYIPPFWLSMLENGDTLSYGTFLNFIMKNNYI